MAELTKLVCKECAFENEMERVYCHNCGTKLDRSQVPIPVSNEETKKQLAKRVKKIGNPSGGFFAGWKRNLFKTLAWSIVISALILIALPPDNIPEKLKREQLGEYVPLGDVLFTSSKSGVSQPIAMREDVVNRFLQNVLKPKKTGVIADELKFERAFAHFKDEVCWVAVETSFFDYPLYASSGWYLEIKDGKLDATPAGGTIGRLRLPKEIMPYVSKYGLESLWHALKSERKNISDMKSVEVRDGVFIVVPKGAQPPSSQPAPAPAPAVQPSATPAGTPTPALPSTSLQPSQGLD